MVNCNPETVSTDYDTSDRLYFEPLTLEDVLAICDEEAQKGELVGVIVQFGGQTPLKLAVPLEQAGVRLLGTTADAIDRAEDRGRFDELLTKLALRRPRGGIANERRARHARSPRASAIRCWCAALRARRPRDDDLLHATPSSRRTSAWRSKPRAKKAARRRSSSTSS